MMLKNLKYLPALLSLWLLFAIMASFSCAMSEAKYTLVSDGTEFIEEVATVALNPIGLVPQKDNETVAPYTTVQLDNIVLYVYNSHENTTSFRVYSTYNGLTGYYPVTLNLIAEHNKPGLFILVLQEDDTILQETELSNNPLYPDFTEDASGNKLATVFTSNGMKILLPVAQTPKKIQSTIRTPVPAAPAVTEVPENKDSITTTTIEVTRAIDFSTNYIEDPETYIDEPERIISEGVKGEKIVTYSITYINGIETHREKTSERIVVEPVNRVVVRGSKIREIEVETISATYATISWRGSLGESYLLTCYNSATVIRKITTDQNLITLNGLIPDHSYQVEIQSTTSNSEPLTIVFSTLPEQEKNDLPLIHNVRLAYINKATLSSDSTRTIQNIDEQFIKFRNDNTILLRSGPLDAQRSVQLLFISIEPSVFTRSLELAVSITISDGACFSRSYTLNLISSEQRLYYRIPLDEILGDIYSSLSDWPQSHCVLRLYFDGMSVYKNDIIFSNDT